MIDKALEEVLEEQEDEIEISLEYENRFKCPNCGDDNYDFSDEYEEIDGENILIDTNVVCLSCGRRIF